MWQRFTERARKAVFYAQEEAGKWGENFVGPEHLLLGLVHEDDNLAARILTRLGVKTETVRKEVQARLQPGEGEAGKDMQLTPAAKSVVDGAYDEAKRLGDNYIGGEHLLLAMLREEAGLASEVLAQLGVTPEGVGEQLQEIKDASKQEADKPSEELLSLDEAVKFLGTSKPTLYRLLGQDEIKGLKVGRQWRFRKADLIAYMERGPVAVAAAPKEDLDMELAFFAQQLSEPEPDDVADPETKTIRLAHKIIQLAINAKASDIHLEPNANDFLLRYRADGVLQEIRRLPTSTRESLTARYKTMAEMDINEKRLPQDGRIAVRHEDKDFDLRVAVLPSMYGEAITMRILAKQDILLGLDKLGIATEDLRQIRDLMHQPNGIVLATGPTGSGKTTLLYSCLQEVAAAEKKTVTVEDPVEFTLPYTTQTQINKRGGLTFPIVLRSFLRQDPDIILVERDARPGNGPDRRRGFADRAPASFGPAHRGRPLGPAAAAGHGRRAVPDLRHRRGRRRHAPGAPGLRELQAALRPLGRADPGLRRPARQRGRLRDSRRGGLRARRGLRAVPGARLPGPDGPVRSPAR